MAARGAVLLRTASLRDTAERKICRAQPIVGDDTIDRIRAALCRRSQTVIGRLTHFREDTSVAHFAGAMGNPVWMLDHYNTDWRWRLTEDRSPWYPTMRIFRQQRCGDWQEPVARLAAALGQLGG